MQMDHLAYLGGTCIVSAYDSSAGLAQLRAAGLGLHKPAKAAKVGLQIRSTGTATSCGCSQPCGTVITTEAEHCAGCCSSMS